MGWLTKLLRRLIGGAAHEAEGEAAGDLARDRSQGRESGSHAAPSGAEIPEPGADTEHADIADVVEMPIDGELDLHTFSPKETREVVIAYIEEAHARGLREIRVVHGKGKGVQRRIVHSVLAEHPLVVRYRTAGEGRGGWGATLVELAP
jgi:DNA-nicking Smr family endonuclease